MSKTMQKVLVVKSSMNGEKGCSNRLAEAFLSQLGGGVKPTIRDVGAKPLAHLSSEEMGAWSVPEGERTAEQKRLAAVSDEIIKEVQDADVLALSVSMYNFGVPSTLKAWIDRLLRAGVTFGYTATGPAGLLKKGKKVYVLVASGGAYAGKPYDTLTPYLTNLLSLVGLTDITFIRAEDTAKDAEGALRAGVEEINRLF